MFAISRRGGKQPFHRLFGRIVFCGNISGRDNATTRPFESCFIRCVPDRIPPLTISRATYKTMRINTLWQSLYVRYLATGRQTTVSSVIWPHCFCESSGWWMQCGCPPVRILFWYYIKSRRRCGSFLHGVPDRIRTCNRQNRNLKLYPIALQAHKENFGCVLSFASVCFLNCRSRFKNFRQNYRLKFSKNNSPYRKNLFVVS